MEISSSNSLKAVLLNAYLELIGSQIGDPTATVGVVTNGRSARLSDPLRGLGLFWTLLPFGRQKDHSLVDDQLRDIQEQLSVNESHALYPLQQIERDRGEGELFFATFNFVNFHNAAKIQPDNGLRFIADGGHDKFHYPLNYVFAVASNDGELAVHAEYDNAYFSNLTIEVMNATLLDILARYCAE